MGNMLAHVGQAAYSLGASTLPQVGTCVTKTVPKVSIERNVSKGMQSANITDSFLLMRNQKSILIDSQIYLFRVVVVVSPAFSRDTNQKNETRIARRTTDRSFTDIFLILLSQWFFYSGFDSVGFASAGALRFSICLAMRNGYRTSSSNRLQPPLVLPRRGDAGHSGYW